MVPLIVPVCDDLAACANRLASKRRAGVPILLYGLEEVSVHRSLPKPLLVEEVLKFGLRNPDNTNTVIVCHERS